MSSSLFSLNSLAWLNRKILFLSLFVLIFFSFLLIACSRGASSNNDVISLALVKSFFPAFPDNHTLSSVATGKNHNASAAQIDNFNVYVIQAGLYDYEGYGRYFNDNVSLNTNATVYLSDKNIDLYLESDTEFNAVASDATYNSVFGSIDGYVLDVHITKFYDENENLSSKFVSYVTLLSSPPHNFTCGYFSRDWYCYKRIGDILYQWNSLGNASHTYRITKNGVMAVPVKD
ncbi:MAG: hypothetical protein LBS73_03080 [Campylobacteraceae bacterium]|jgi:hypothetical protein|nr:hypothetical protein [Campylobacteraceae bacterium]